MKTYIGLDIGGTKIYAARFNERYEIEEDIRIPSQAKEGKEKVLNAIQEAINTVKNETTKSVGISWAGFVDDEKGIIYKAPNIKGFEDFHITKYLEEKINIPVFLGNDARLFALAEQRLDETNPKTLLGIILGTGVGSGIIIEGHIFRGDQNFAGEIGHMIFRKNEKLEIEDLFSGPAMEKFFQEKMGIYPLKAVEEILPERMDEVLLNFDSHLDYLAIWIYNLLMIFNPSKIVFGGGAGENFLPFFHEVLTKKIQKLLDAKNYPTKFELRYSKLKNAGAIGAAILAKRRSILPSSK